MQYAFTPEQLLFRDSLQRFCADASPPETVRQLAQAGHDFDPKLWRLFCDELGGAGLHIPEAHGGAGFGAVELGLAMEAQGATLFGSPMLSSAVMAGYALMISGSEEAQARLLPAIANGASVTSLAVTEHDGFWPDDVMETTANGPEDAPRLTGEKRFVVDGMSANRFLVVARAGDKPHLYEVAVDTDGLKRKPIEALDPTRKLATITLNNSPATRLSPREGFTLEDAFTPILIAFAHEMIGGAQALFASTLDYTKMRYQFGRQIASFQAMKHRCADLLVDLELAKASVYQAAQKLAAGDNADSAASTAKALASETYMKVALEAVQLRGGIGFTWEEDAHFWFKRAKASEVFLGTPAQHRERYLALRGTGDE